MAITVASTTTAATTSVVRPTASVSVVVPTIGVSYAVPVSAISYIALSVAEELDVTGRYRFVAEAQVVVDAQAFSLTKPLSDAVSLESNLAFDLARPVVDTQALTDALVASVGKVLADTYSVPDAITRDIAKAAFDAFPLTDDSIYTISKLLNDGVAMNDSFDASDGSLYSIAKYFMNMAFVDETLRRDVDKALVDAVLASEAKAIDFVKAPFTETLAPPTDFSIRVAQLGKSDAAAATDATLYELTKLLSDVVTYAQYIALAHTKPFADDTNLSDTSVLGVIKAAADSAAVSDAYALVVDKVLADSTALADVVTTTLIFIRSFSDTLSVSEFATLVFDRPLAESVSLADSQARTVSKLISDGFALNDLADVGDGITFSFGQTVANVALMVDNSTRQLQLGKAEAISAADSGSLINQGYCDLTYFAEDYVGASRSF